MSEPVAWDEPVAWIRQRDNTLALSDGGVFGDDWTPLYSAALAQPKTEHYPLPESLYPDSKDWVASDYAGRVEWLHFMYESKKREVEQLEAAQPEQKPVAWMYEYANSRRERGLGFYATPEATCIPLYTHPHQRKPLTDDQIAEICMDCSLVTPSDIYFARAIEKAHGIE